MDLNADVNIVLANDDGGWLVVADVSIKSFEFRGVAVYASNIAAERVSFYRQFTRCPDLPVQVFRNYLADFLCLREMEPVSCECMVTECEVRDTLKQVGFNKPSGLDDLSYKVFLRLPHKFVPILTDMFNHWFAQGANPW